mmetsp:Transcript_30898/g.48414  ORF Transcript_30898/g.48414 Transcript_30898/m.48414 type:complete len:332 (+) Transcript_30898:184-1179(+)|eukprot:CAMPEP_0201732948 /NCGR_PEP_ID=MMETSP0593-20130828/30249_1 /ASSEMBLY_ACC=CAM_ASM_000672 /TAXON_ID=267983 /ORGANISM="Skeletonema japonicum, Strain CCMP2506" /LENGTH=331 /DNA_ID=CAMNT_0048226019 /DNA_START=112 /DNA_END=1107 /DNA_ORIENTATION=-
MTEDDATTTTPPILEEVVWRDDLIRWEGGLNVDIQKNSNDNDGDESSDDGQSFLMDPFADPDPFQMFDFDFDLPSSNNNIERAEVDQADDDNKEGKVDTISLKIKGYKTDAEQVWQSTGLTLWRASHYLCEYQVEHPELFCNTRVLELGAGLGLNGILAWRLSCVGVNTDDDGARHEKSDEITSEVCITDGDSDALVHLRDNIERNRPINTTAADNNDTIATTTSKVSCHQLIWGEESSQKFLQHIAHNQKYNVLLASDIIYSPVIVQPLWETVQTLLEKEDGVFVMAFARRKVPVSIDLVLEKAVEFEFEYTLVKEDLEDGIWVYEFRFR